MAAGAPAILAPRTPPCRSGRALRPGQAPWGSAVARAAPRGATDCYRRRGASTAAPCTPSGPPTDPPRLLPALLPPLLQMSVSPADLEELEEVEGWVMMMAELEVGAAAAPLASWTLALCLQRGYPARAVLPAMCRGARSRQAAAAPPCVVVAAHRAFLLLLWSALPCLPPTPPNPSLLPTLPNPFPPTPPPSHCLPPPPPRCRAWSRTT